jgi:glycosyltransferase involved in cell wall biosynthesis
LDIPESTTILLTVGRNVRKKSFQYAVQALYELRQRGLSVVLVHVGKEGNGEDLRDLADRLGVAGEFFSMGEVSYFDMPNLYSSADVFVFPSKMETFGNVTLEAMASCLPCVEFDYGANAEKIEEGKTGYIVPYGDLETLVSRIEQLVGNRVLREDMGRLAREAVEREFSWPSVAKRYRQVVRDVSDRIPSRRRSIESIMSQGGFEELLARVNRAAFAGGSKP